MSEMIKHVSDTTFEQDVLKSGNPVLVDFWAEWCGPCKMFAPVLDEVAKTYQGKLTVAKLDIDANPATPGKYDAPKYVTCPTSPDQGLLAVIRVDRHAKQK